MNETNETAASEALDASAPRPPREPPIPGWKIAAVLIGIVVLTCVCAVGFTVAYAWYIDAHNLR